MIGAALVGSLFALGLALLRAPRWVSGGMLALSLLPTAALFAVGGPARVLLPLLLQLLALGLLLLPLRPARAARRKDTHSVPEAARAGRDTSSPFDLWDIPGFDVLEKVGSGGMASVFRARRRRDRKLVALKIPAEAFLSDLSFIRRFHREAEVARRLSHPNIVETFEHGDAGSKHYLAMEFVDGRSLESYIDVPEHLSNYAASRELMRQAVAALRHVHEAGIVHRDIKPANFMVRLEGVQRPGLSVRPSLRAALGKAPRKASSKHSPLASSVAPDALKLMDFGVAEGQLLAPSTPAPTRVGTPSYMSPEGARGLRTDARSDVYSLGLVFYELLTGRAAFQGGYEAVVHQQIFALPSPPRQHAPHVPEALERLVMEMIVKAPELRPSLAEVAVRLAKAPLEAGTAELGCRLLCVVAAPHEGLRILDTEGTLHAVVGEVGSSEVGSSPGALPAPPQACSSDPFGNLYLAVLEAGAQAEHPLIHKLSAEGEPLLAFGGYGMGAGKFLRPVALASAPDATLWVLDAETHLVQRFSACGAFISSFGGQGGGEGRFNDPRDLLVGAEGDIFVLDYGNRRVQHFSPDGHYRNCWAFRAPTEGARRPDGAAAFRPLSGFALGRSGELYLAEAQSGKVHSFAPTGGEVSTVTLEPSATEQRAEFLSVGSRAAEPRAAESLGVGPRAAAALTLSTDLPTPSEPYADRLTDLGIDDRGNLLTALRGGREIRKYAPDGTLIASLETYAPIVQLRVDVSSR